MIKLTDIRDSVVGALANMYPETTVYDERQQQGMRFPCFFVQLIPVSTRRYKARVNKDKTIFSIQYFSDSENTFECLEVKDNLDSVFSKNIYVSGELIRVDSVELSTKRETKGSSINYLVTLDYYNVIEPEDICAPMGDVEIDF